jgi:hypothetical protein
MLLRAASKRPSPTLNASAGKFAVNASATILFVLHQLDDTLFDELVDETLTRINVSRPLSVTWVLCPRKVFQAVIGRVHLLLHWALNFDSSE